MPLGAARATLLRRGGTFVPFELIAAVSATSTTDGGASLTSNALTWDEDDFLLAFGSASHGDTSRPFIAPTPDWSPGSETWSVLFSERALISTQAVTGGIAVATALDAQAAKTLAVNFDGSTFTRVAGFARCKGPTIVRQIKTAKIEGAGTSIAATFDEPVLPTSQIVGFVMHRNDGAISAPAGFTTIFDDSPSAQQRSHAFARIEPVSDTVTITGLNSSAGKLLCIVELARPGQELS